MSPFVEPVAPGQPVVIKIGSRSIVETKEDGTRDVKKSVVKSACKSAAQLLTLGYKPVIVTSGAVAAGMGVMGVKDRPAPDDEQSLSGLAGIGQPHLFSIYLDELRSEHDIIAAQVLPDWTTFRDSERRSHLALVLDGYFAQGIIPIVNGNDATSFADLKFGDNDMMSALIAILVGASHLVLTTDVAGLLLDIDGERTLVDVVDELTPEILNGIRGKNIDGTGGMGSKILAADLVRHAGILSFITSVSNLDRIEEVLNRDLPSTFLNLRSTGTVNLDDACEIIQAQALAAADGKLLSSEEYLASRHQ